MIIDNSLSPMDDIFTIAELFKLSDSRPKRIAIEGYCRRYKVSRESEERTKEMLYEKAWIKLFEQNPHLVKKDYTYDEQKLSNTLEIISDKLSDIVLDNKHKDDYVDAIVIPENLAYTRTTDVYTTSIPSFKILNKCLSEYQSIFVTKQTSLLNSYLKTLEELCLNLNNMSLQENKLTLNTAYDSYKSNTVIIFNNLNGFDLSYTLPGTHYFSYNSETTIGDIKLVTKQTFQPHPHSLAIKKSLLTRGVCIPLINDLPNIKEVIETLSSYVFVDVSDVFKKASQWLNTKLETTLNEAYLEEVETLKFKLLQALLCTLNTIHEYQKQIISFLNNLEKLLDNIQKGTR